MLSLFLKEPEPVCVRMSGKEDAGHTTSKALKICGKVRRTVADKGFYPHILCLVLNIGVLVITSILMISYQIQLFSLLTSHFLICPLLLTVSSLTGLACSVLGVSSVASKGKRLIILHGVSSFLVVGLSLTSCVSTTFLVSLGTSDIQNVSQNNSMVLQEKREVWEEIQAQYSCCGLTGKSGHEQWLPILGDRYPDSCCTLKYPNCGRHARQTLASDFANTFSERIFSTGCLTVLAGILEERVSPMVLCACVMSAVICLCQLSISIQFVTRNILKTRKKQVITKPVRTSLQVPKEETHCPVHGEKKISTISRVSRRPSDVSTSGIPRRQSKISRKESSVSRKSVRSIKSNGLTMNE